MRIKLKNIQSYRDELIELPDTGLVQFIGGNSEGKSVLGKVTSAIAKMDIESQEVRDALINDNVDSGYVIYEYKNRGLSVVLHRDRNQCAVTLIRESGERITRTFREKGIRELLFEFGFRVYGKDSICLQVLGTFDIIPFVSSSNSVNFEIVDSIATDHIAQTFLTNYKQRTYTKARDLMKEASNRINALSDSRRNLMCYDYEAYEALHKELKECYDVIKYLVPITLTPIEFPRKINIVKFPKLCLQPIKVFEPMPVLRPITSLAPVFNRAKDVSKGKCPACGKPLTTHECRTEGK